MAATVVLRTMGSRTLSARDASATGSTNDDRKTLAISVVVVAAILVAIGIAGLVAFRLKKRNTRRHQRLNSQDSENQSTAPAREVSNIGAGTRSNRNSTFAANRLSVRSIRSIISLPAYNEQPRETEEVIARAGEREGLDYIIEGPETAEEVEAQRQEEMAAIFRVQQTRRRELEERAERRRARRAALDRQDYREVARLDRLAAEARRRRNASQSNLSLDGINVEELTPSSGDLIAELQQIRARPRKVSEVSYRDLGRARHDGSRIRERGLEGDAAPLLESPAAMGGRSSEESRNRSRASSVGSQNPTLTSRPVTRERSRSRASRTGGTDDCEEMIRRLSDEGIPPEPPSYDDDLSVHAGEAPRYEDVIGTPNPDHAPDSPTSNREHAPIPHANSDDQTRSTPSPSETSPDVESHPNVASTVAPTNTSTASGPPPQARHHHDDDAASQRTVSAVPSRLQTRGIGPPPAIEVVSATPVHTAPSTPTTTTFSRRNEEEEEQQRP